MFLKVKVFPGSKKTGVIQKGEDSFLIKVKAKPKQGKANQEMRELLANYLHLSLKQVHIIKGRQQKNKIVHIVS